MYNTLLKAMIYITIGESKATYDRFVFTGETLLLHNTRAVERKGQEESVYTYMTVIRRIWTH